jgi:hypothetical protein
VNRFAQVNEEARKIRPSAGYARLGASGIQKFARSTEQGVHVMSYTAPMVCRLCGTPLGVASCDVVESGEGSMRDAFFIALPGMDRDSRGVLRQTHHSTGRFGGPRFRRVAPWPSARNPETYDPAASWEYDLPITVLCPGSAAEIGTGKRNCRRVLNTIDCDQLL